jgi:arsenate reductase (thioredoxin)
MPGPPKLRVLFVCIGNACRSPMAEAIARHLANDIIEPSSAGLSPLGHLSEITQQVLCANGYPLDGLSSKPLRRDALESADLVIDLSGGALEQLSDSRTGEPLAADKVETWDVPDPYGETHDTYQRILEELELKVLLLASRLRTDQRTANANA